MINLTQDEILQMMEEAGQSTYGVSCIREMFSVIEFDEFDGDCAAASWPTPSPGSDIYDPRDWVS